MIRLISQLMLLTAVKHSYYFNSLPHYCKSSTRQTAVLLSLRLYVSITQRVKLMCFFSSLFAALDFDLCDTWTLTPLMQLYVSEPDNNLVYTSHHLI